MVYGDLDGDSLDEAAVTTLFGDGGTGQISSIVVYRIIDGQLRLAGRIEGGDWSNGGIYDAEITGGYLWVDTFGNESWVCYADRLVETQRASPSMAWSQSIASRRGAGSTSTCNRHQNSPFGRIPAQRC